MRHLAISISLAALACSTPSPTPTAPDPVDERQQLGEPGDLDGAFVIESEPADSTDDAEPEAAEVAESGLGYLGESSAPEEPTPAPGDVGADDAPEDDAGGEPESAAEAEPVTRGTELVLAESDTPVVRASTVPRSEPGNPQEAPQAADGFDHSHARWTEVLRQHVQDDRFDYAALKREPRQLEIYLEELRGVTPEQLGRWTREQRYAFWINVYNAHAIALILGEYPVDSIKDLGSLFSKVWDKEFIAMSAHHPDGKDDELSLDDVEHEILRPQFEDARVHAAVNCASIGCPPLRDEAFVAKRLNEQLDEQMRSFLADERRNRFDRAANEIYISKIFDWFAGDFERDAQSVRQYVRRYHPGDDDAWILDAKISYLDYDWDLNDVPKKDR